VRGEDGCSSSARRDLVGMKMTRSVGTLVSLEMPCGERKAQSRRGEAARRGVGGGGDERICNVLSTQAGPITRRNDLAASFKLRTQIRHWPRDANENKFSWGRNRRTERDAPRATAHTPRRHRHRPAHPRQDPPSLASPTITRPHPSQLKPRCHSARVQRVRRSRDGSRLADLHRQANLRRRGDLHRDGDVLHHKRLTQADRHERESTHDPARN
jgi:hypothetical protein